MSYFGAPQGPFREGQLVHSWFWVSRGSHGGSSRPEPQEVLRFSNNQA